MAATIQPTVIQQSETITDATITQSAALTYDTFGNGDDVQLAVKNNGSGSLTATIPKTSDTVPVDGHAPKSISDITLTLAAGKWGVINVPKAGYLQTTGLVRLNFNTPADAKVGLYRLDRQ